MKDIKEIEEACERAAHLQCKASDKGSRYPGMSYEDGLREGLDWVMGNQEEDPTIGADV